MMRKLVLALLAVGSLVFFLRVCRRRREHIDLYYDDGSMVSLKPGTLEAGRVVPYASDALRAAREPTG